MSVEKDNFVGSNKRFIHGNTKALTCISYIYTTLDYLLEYFAFKTIQRMGFLPCLICFLVFVLIFLNTFASSKRQLLCPPEQRNALLKFKSEFTSSCNFSTSYPRTESWAIQSDCCYWDGITCEATSGEVIELDLSCSCFQGQLSSESSLFKLQKLRVINLAYNDFSSSVIPTQFGILFELRRLNLSNSWLSGQIPTELLHLTKLMSLDLSYNSLSSEESFLNKLVQNLTNLHELNLGLVDISSEIPQNISNLSSLKSLSLDNCNFFGKFPSNLLLIPTIQSINLYNNQGMEGSLPEFDGNNSLVLLDLSFTSFSGNLPDSINNLKHLNDLRLESSAFSGKIPSSLGNLSKLLVLELSNNFFSGQIPSSIGNLFHLTHLDLSSNRLDGQIPSSFVNLKQLTSLRLDSNMIGGNFPLPPLNLTRLKFLSLTDNHFKGTLPPNISVLSNLKTFEASHNTFTGTLSSALFNIPSLTLIDLKDNELTHVLEFGNSSSPSRLERLLLGHNHFRGPIPISISKLVRVRELDLSYFNTGMSVDFGIFSQLKELMDLDLSYLNTTGTVDLSILFSHLKSLSKLDLSGQHVSTSKMGSNSSLPPHLDRLQLSGCGITEFPEFVQNLQHLSDLDLSNNNIKGRVPKWIWKLPRLMNLNLSSNSFTRLERSSNDVPVQEILMLDLSSNAFQGPLVIPPVTTEAMLVSKNNFTGKIPRSICRHRFLNVLDLSNNNFTGSIPRCLRNLNEYLSVLNLRYNQLTGNIPEIFTNATELTSLDLSHNGFVGTLPRSLKDCPVLEVLNVGSNKIDDAFPFWLSSLPKLKVMVLRNNRFKGLLYRPRHSFGYPNLQIIDIANNHFTGNLPSYYFAEWNMTTSKDFKGFRYIGDGGSYYHDSMVLISKGVEMKLERIFTLLTAIDFSGNKLQGMIPESVGLLKDLIVLNLSSNVFTGNIPSSLANLTELESLDLSHNKLSGHIPPALGGLTSISNITVSHNQLVGPIPQSTQFQTQSASSFEGNLGLCGLPLSEKCGDNVEKEQSQVLGSEEEEDEGILSWTAAAIGLAPGIILGLTIEYILNIPKARWFMNTAERFRSF